MRIKTLSAYKWTLAWFVCGMNVFRPKCSEPASLRIIEARMSWHVFRVCFSLLQSRLKAARLLCVAWSNTLFRRRRSLKCFQRRHVAQWSSLENPILLVHFKQRDISQKRTNSPLSACKKYVICDRCMADSSHVAYWCRDFGLLAVSSIISEVCND